MRRTPERTVGICHLGCGLPQALPFSRPLGVRPLFYTQTGSSFLFASEAKALLAHPEVEGQLDLHALDQIFTFWVTLPSQTAFRKIKQLPPGHCLVFKDGQVRISEYWRLHFSPDIANDDAEPKLAEELLALLIDATRIRLRSDVPVGAYLSGGLDSTCVTALAKQAVGDRLRTFSVSFDDIDFDESAYQRAASSFLKTEHSFICCSHEDIAAEFSKVIWHTEQPILRTAPVPLFLLSKLVRDSGFKVVLTVKVQMRYSADTTFSKRRRFAGFRHNSQTHRGVLFS